MKLTKTQWAYIEKAGWEGRLNKGAGYASTQTVRLLAERGLVNLTTYPELGRADTWTIQLTNAGRALFNARFYE